MNAPRQPKCALSRVQINEIDVEEIKRDGFINHGILVVRVDDPRLGWIEKKVCEDIGNKLYGKGNRINGNR